MKLSYCSWNFFIRLACNFWEWCTCAGPYDERQPVQGTEPVWLHAAVCCTAADSWASLPTNLIREKLLVTWSVIYIESLGHLYMKAYISCLQWNTFGPHPCSLPSRHLGCWLQYQSVEIFTPKDVCWLFYNKMPRKGDCARLVLQEFAAIGWALLPTPWLLLWTAVNAGAVYIMVGLACSPAE